MSNKWPRVIRDAVHGLIVFEDNPTGRLLFDLIDTPEFQRLRRIRQLGVSEFVFPGATHTRFNHSLGVLAIGRRFLARIDDLMRLGALTEAPSDMHKTAVQAACLLHDIGHGPFSHAFESVSGDDHEKRSVEIIQSPVTAVHKLLLCHHESLPSLVAALIGKEVATRDLGEGMPDYLFRIVSGEFDADRADYLLRDSHFTGSPDGQFDLEWLIQHLYVDTGHDRFYFGQKALSAVETMLFARYHMYKNVYFHKATRAAEVMLNLSFKRLRTILEKDGVQAVKANLLPDVPLLLLRAFAGEGLPLGEFLFLDDSVVMSFIKSCASCSDPALKMLGTGLIERRLYKCCDLTERLTAGSHKFYHVGITMAKAKLPDLPDDCLLPEDTPTATAYKPYDPDSGEPNTQIYLELPTKECVEISGHSPLVKNLTKYQMVRFYFPQSISDSMADVIDKHIKGGQ